MIKQVMLPLVERSSANGRVDMAICQIAAGFGIAYKLKLTLEPACLLRVRVWESGYVHWTGPTSLFFLIPRRHVNLALSSEVLSGSSFDISITVKQKNECGRDRRSLS